MPMPEPTESSAPKRATTCPAVGHAQRGAGAAAVGRGVDRDAVEEPEDAGGFAAGGRELCDDDVGLEGVRVDVELDAEGVRVDDEVDAEGDGVVARGGVDFGATSGGRAAGAGAAAT